MQRYLSLVFPGDQICPFWRWDDLVSTPVEQLNRYRVFRGHFLGYLDGYLGRKLTLLTMLRDPIERTISHYYFHRSIPASPFYEQASSRSLREFCLDPTTRWRLENYQAVSVLTTLWHSRDKEFTSVPDDPWSLQRRIEATVCRAVPARYMFETATLALDRFAAVGITGRFSESLRLFSRTLGVPDVQVDIHENSVADRPSAGDIDAETLEIIQNLTEADRMLYDYACKRFAERITALGAALPEAGSLGS